MMNRRTLVAGAGALASTPALAEVRKTTLGRSFPKGFLWGAATAAYQVEGNNTNSDCWLLENAKPTIFHEPSGDAANSFELWPTDLDLVRGMGLNSYRFSLEWARIEPEQGLFSQGILDHYKRIVEGCRVRGLNPILTFNHFTTPRWFALNGGWTRADAADLFARFCDRSARHLGDGVAYATTLNEPNIPQLLAAEVPIFARLTPGYIAMTQAAAKANGGSEFVFAPFSPPPVAMRALPNLLAAHKAGRAAIKAAHPKLPVGVSLAMVDEQAVGDTGKRDAIRREVYGAWLDAAKTDDFIGVQNYNRNVWMVAGRLPPPADALRNPSGQEIYPASLAGAVAYAHEATGLPVLVTEHGVDSQDDKLRMFLIPAALEALKETMDRGVPVLGYIHWSLIDNFEWNFGYTQHFGLHAVDRVTFQRTPRPSVELLSSIARRNAV